MFVQGPSLTPRWWGEYRVISTHAVEIHLNIMKKRCNGVGAWSGGPHPMVGRVQIHIDARGEVTRGTKISDGRSFCGYGIAGWKP